MICKMFTINGKAPTIGNTALTGSAIADPGIVLEYYNTGTNEAHYAGITLRGPSSNTADIDYSDMCYYSNTKYDNPNPADLTKAFFYPIAQLLKVQDPLYTTKQCFTARYGYVADMPLIFPLDEEYNHVGAYLIPRSAYSASSLYVYLWLPSVTGAPEGNDTVGVDFTTLEPQGANIGINIVKCDMPAYNNVAFNQTYIKSAINCKFPTSAHQYFGWGDLIETKYLSPIVLMSGCDIRQYQSGQDILSAYDSKFYGFPSANYVENCDISGHNRYLANTVCNCYVQSALNSKLHNIFFKSANNCDIYVDGDLSGSAFNSKLTINEDYGNNSRCLINCTASGLIQNDTYLTAEDSYITSTYLNPVTVIMFGHYKNTYVTYTANPMYSGTYYAEDYPTKPFVKI